LQRELSHRLPLAHLRLGAWGCDLYRYAGRRRLIPQPAALPQTGRYGADRSGEGRSVGESGSRVVEKSQPSAVSLPRFLLLRADASLGGRLSVARRVVSPLTAFRAGRRRQCNHREILLVDSIQRSYSCLGYHLLGCGAGVSRLHRRCPKGVRLVASAVHIYPVEAIIPLSINLASTSQV